MKAGFTRRQAGLVLAAVLVFLGGFAAGFIVCVQNQRISHVEQRARYQQDGGDASPATRAGVLATLKRFQAGYSRRATSDVDLFMRSVFDSGADILVLGTDESEWVRGYPAVSNFVRGDWQNWGDLQLNLDETIVNSVQDVAWLTTTGNVQFGVSKRPLRFSAILTRAGNNWLLRQVQFQWDDHEPKPEDLLHIATYSQVFQLEYRRIMPKIVREAPAQK